MPKKIIYVKDPKANYELPSMEDLFISIGQRVRDLRKQHGMSQLELAKNLGKKSAAYIANIENGERNMRATDLVRLAHHLKVKLSYFYP